MRKSYPISSDLKAAGMVFQARLNSAIGSTEQGWERTGSPTFSDDGVTLSSSDELYTDFPDPSLFNQESSEGWTAVFELTPSFALDSGDSRYLITGLSAGPTTEYLLGFTGSNALVLWSGGTAIGSASYATMSPHWNNSSKNILIVSCKSGDSNMWLNGNQIMTNDATTWTGSQIDQLIIGQYNTEGTIHRFEVYREACTSVDEVVLRNKTLISDISTENSIVTLPLERDYDNGSNVQVTPILGQLAGTAFMGADGTTSAEFPSKLTHKLRGYFFDGGDFITVPDDPLIQFGNGTVDRAFSIGVVINFDVLTVNRAVFGKGVVGSNGELYILYNSAVDTIEFVLSDEVAGGIIRVRSNAGIIQPGYTGFLVGTYDGSGSQNGLCLYYDGIDVSGARASTSYTAISPQSVDLWIGRYSTTYLIGELTLPKVYGSELSPMQVKALHVRMMSEVVR